MEDPVISISPITPEEFERFRRLLQEHAGITLLPEKRVMVASRLAKRLNFYGLTHYGAYFRLATDPEHPEEFQILVNALTTNETYFFREPSHFEFLRDTMLPAWPNKPIRIWSAACSSGEEAYSLAMVLADKCRDRPWEILGSDLSTRVLDVARTGIYPMDRIEQLDRRLMEKYCLKGVRSQADHFRVGAELRERVKFEQINLTQPLPGHLGKFDAIFLRNVLIYFDQDTKKRVVDNLLPALQPHGYFVVSHAESLHSVTRRLQTVIPSIYRLS